MLQSIDKALAGAIDAVADDIQATVKSVREKGVSSTLKGAVQEAADLVAAGAGSVLSGIGEGKKGPNNISTHSGVASSYADICANSSTPTGAGAGVGAGSGGVPCSDGAAFEYVPPASRGRSDAVATAVSKPTPGDFAPSIGIRRAVQAAGYAPPSGVQVFARPGGSQGDHSASTSAASSTAPVASAESSSMAEAPAVAGKDPTIGAVELAARLDTIKRREAENNRCFDCGAQFSDWASVSFGVFLCIRCAGHHRGMGVHISRVRSCKMDSWTERQVRVFDHGGNRRLAEFFAANDVPAELRSHRFASPAAEWYRESWIKSRIFGRDVAAPPAGVVLGPCATGAQSAAQAAARPADLLDFGAGSPTAAVTSQGDLLSFDEKPGAASAASAASGAHVEAAGTAVDLLDMGSAGGPAAASGTRLLSAEASSVGGLDLQSLGNLGAASDLDGSLFRGLATCPVPHAFGPQSVSPALTSTPQGGLLQLGSAPTAAPDAASFGSLLMGLPQASPAAVLVPGPGAPSAMAVVGDAMAAPAQGTSNSRPMHAVASAKQEEERTVDPFAMALLKWGM